MSSTRRTNYRYMLFWLSLCFAHEAVKAGRQASFTYIGCFNDNVGGVRDLRGMVGLSKLGVYSVYTGGGGGSVIVSSMTWQYCSGVCSVGGFSYFGVQNGNGCYCSRTYPSQAKLSDSACSFSCAGNSSQICGFLDRNSVFAQTYTHASVFTATNATGLTIIGSYALPMYWNISARDRTECIFQCNADCQAVIFSKQQQLCYHLIFAAVPPGLTNVDGESFVRL